MAKIRCKECGHYTEEEQRYCLYCSTRLGSSPKTQYTDNRSSDKSNRRQHRTKSPKEDYRSYEREAHTNHHSDHLPKKKKGSVGCFTLIIIAFFVIRLVSNLVGSINDTYYDYSYDLGDDFVVIDDEGYLVDPDETNYLTDEELVVEEEVSNGTFSSEMVFDESAEGVESYALSNLNDKNEIYFYQYDTGADFIIRGEISESELGDMQGYYNGELWLRDNYGNYIILPVDLDNVSSNQAYTYVSFDNDDYMVVTEKGEFYFSQSDYTYYLFNDFDISAGSKVNVEFDYSTYQFNDEVHMVIDAYTIYDDGEFFTLTGDYQLLN